MFYWPSQYWIGKRWCLHPVVHLQLDLVVEKERVVKGATMNGAEDDQYNIPIIEKQCMDGWRVLATIVVFGKLLNTLGVKRLIHDLETYMETYVLLIHLKTYHTLLIYYNNLNCCLSKSCLGQQSHFPVLNITSHLTVSHPLSVHDWEKIVKLYVLYPFWILDAMLFRMVVLHVKYLITVFPGYSQYTKDLLFWCRIEYRTVYFWDVVPFVKNCHSFSKQLNLFHSANFNGQESVQIL